MMSLYKVLNLFFLSFTIRINKGRLYKNVGIILGTVSDGLINAFQIAIIIINATKDRYTKYSRMINFLHNFFAKSAILFAKNIT